jgi:hypothetical protein
MPRSISAGLGSNYSDKKLKELNFNVDRVNRCEHSRFICVASTRQRSKEGCLTILAPTELLVMHHDPSMMMRVDVSTTMPHSWVRAMHADAGKY